MAVLKVRCPECDASIRQSIDPVDEPTDFPVTCPKCSTEFTATAAPEAAPKPDAKKSSAVAKTAAAKRTVTTDDEEPETKRPKKNGKNDSAEGRRAKKNRADDEDEDEDDETPRKGKKGKKQDEKKSNLPLILGGVGVLLLLVGGGVTAGDLRVRRQEADCQERDSRRETESVFNRQWERSAVGSRRRHGYGYCSPQGSVDRRNHSSDAGRPVVESRSDAGWTNAPTRRSWPTWHAPANGYAAAETADRNLHGTRNGQRNRRCDRSINATQKGSGSLR